VITPSIWPTPTGRDWKDGSAKACANIPVNGLLGACAQLQGPRRVMGLPTMLASKKEQRAVSPQAAVLENRALPT
jgi:hypothetical protein